MNLGSSPSTWAARPPRPAWSSMAKCCVARRSKSAPAGWRVLVGAGYLLKLPAIDLAEVGAGGGSICRLDAGGAPKVGPDSAGADPGPVCYGRGGIEPTITDCNLVLGYL